MNIVVIAFGLIVLLAAGVAMGVHLSKLRGHVRKLAETNAGLEARVHECNVEIQRRDDVYRAKEQALQNLNQELGAFSHSVSHDLRAPLGAIAGFSKALETKLGDNADDRARHYLTRIQAGVKKMEALIEALLSFERVARTMLSWGTVNLTKLAREVAQELQDAQPEKPVQVFIEDNLTAQGDAQLLRIALHHLLGNAFKFSSTRGDPQVEFGQQGDEFFVQDNGVGFDMAYADKLFVAFQRLHAETEFPGTGIGLATVRRIIARHQGHIRATSREGEGATFYFNLAKAAPPAITEPGSL